VGASRKRGSVLDRPHSGIREFKRSGTCDAPPSERRRGGIRTPKLAPLRSAIEAMRPHVATRRTWDTCATFEPDSRTLLSSLLIPASLLFTICASGHAAHTLSHHTYRSVLRKQEICFLSAGEWSGARSGAPNGVQPASALVGSLRLRGGSGRGHGSSQIELTSAAHDVLAQALHLAQSRGNIEV
jgi:hypothetical protein